MKVALTWRDQGQRKRACARKPDRMLLDNGILAELRMKPGGLGAYSSAERAQ
jgi:hypothetical protein